MDVVIKLLPGLIAAVTAYVAVKLLALAGIGTVIEEAVVFIIIYLGTAVVADKAMARYGERRR